MICEDGETNRFSFIHTFIHSFILFTDSECKTGAGPVADSGDAGDATASPLIACLSGGLPSPRPPNIAHPPFQFSGSATEQDMCKETLITVHKTDRHTFKTQTSLSAFDKNL